MSVLAPFFNFISGNVNFSVQADPGSVGLIGTFLLFANEIAVELWGTCSDPGVFTGGGNSRIETVIGCVPTDVAPFVSWLFFRLLLIVGGIAFLRMAYGSFLMMTSQGDPKTIAEGQDLFVSSVLGILFIIFSTFLLRFIAVDVLDLNGFE